MRPLTLGWIIRDDDLAAEVKACLSRLPVRVVLERQDVGLFLERLQHAQPDVVLVQPDAGEPVADLITRIKSGPEGPMVIVLDRAADPAVILEAFRGGADEYLYPPLNEDLTHALERYARRRSESRAGARPEGRNAAFLSTKGGCGATTLACCTAIEMARQSKQPILVVDLDLESGQVDFVTGAFSPYSVMDAAANLHRLDASYFQGLISRSPAGVDVLTAPHGLVVSRAPYPDAAQLTQVLRFARSVYPWTVVDLGRALTPDRTAVLREVDDLFLISTADVMALYQSVNMVRQFSELRLEKTRLHLMCNRVVADEESGLRPTEMEKVLGIQVETMIPEDTAAMYEWHTGRRELPRRSRLQQAISQCAARILGRDPASGEDGSAPSESLWASAAAKFRLPKSGLFGTLRHIPDPE